jgi:hypothetical protein
MALTEAGCPLEAVTRKIQELIRPYAGRVEYGNLRMKVSEYECSEGTVTNIALAYETPGGSTDQINITYTKAAGTFALIDAQHGEYITSCVEEVIESILPRIQGIPQKRLDTLYAEIGRHVDTGSNTAGLFGHLNRILQSEFKGGTITHIELRDAMTYAVQYMKGNGSALGRQ